jgi:2-polyprenyl-3-methyl-5-hydroxy-6-metoxy-1,4-benzoquinol methylase
MQHDYERNKAFEQYHETRSAFLDSDDVQKKEWFDFYIKIAYADFFKRTDLKSLKILDVGCGKGFLLNSLYDSGCKDVTGVDLSKGDIAAGRKLFPEIDFVEDDIFIFLEEHKNAFDVIFLKAVIEHVEKVKVIPLLQLINGALRPGGLCVIDVYNADWLFAFHERYMDFTHETGFTQESLRQVMNFAFSEVMVNPLASPLRLSRLEEYKYRICRKIVRWVLGWAEPEMRAAPFLERILIGYGKKRD